MLEKEDLEDLKKKIEENLTSIDQNIKELLEQTKPISPENSLGRITRMDAINNKSVREAALRQAKMKKSRLEVALQKIDDPGFGSCTRCKKAINTKRLMFMPESSMCVSCADK